MLDLTQIINAVVALIAAVVVAYLIPFIRTKLGDARYESLLTYATIAVNAAEQMFKGPGRGEEKLTQAMQSVKAMLAKAGLTFDEEAVREAIENAVLEINTV